jgi:hypothetical protein
VARGGRDEGNSGRGILSLFYTLQLATTISLGTGIGNCKRRTLPHYIYLEWNSVRLALSLFQFFILDERDLTVGCVTSNLYIVLMTQHSSTGARPVFASPSPPTSHNKKPLVPLPWLYSPRLPDRDSFASFFYPEVYLHPDSRDRSSLTLIARPSAWPRLFRFPRHPQCYNPDFNSQKDCIDT